MSQCNAAGHDLKTCSGHGRSWKPLIGLTDPMPDYQHVYILPRHLTASTCGHVTKFCQSLTESIADKIVIDASRLQAADSFGLCLAASILQQITAKGQEVIIRDTPEDQLRYLASMDFFANAGIQMSGIGGRKTQRGRTTELLELRVVEISKDVDRIARELAEATVGRIPGLKNPGVIDEMSGYTERDKLEIPLQYVFIELLENSLTHGKKHHRSSSRAWIACRYDKARDRINLSIVDNGCGLRTSLAGHPAIKDDSDIAAITAAVQPRVSSNRDLGIRIVGHDSINQGIGLTICRDIALRSRGLMHMVSGNGHAMFQKSAMPDRTRSIYAWNGTAVAIELERAALRKLKLNELFLPYQEQSTGGKPRFL